MNTCCINRLREVTCATVNGKAVWFKCRYANCHGGIGHVVITTTDGKKIYDGCPTQASSKYVYIDFDATWLNTLGGIMDVTYKPGDCNWGSHVCNRATFDWGFASDEQTVVGTAYLDNLGGSNDLGNSCGHRIAGNPQTGRDFGFRRKPIALGKGTQNILPDGFALAPRALLPGSG
jgi:hypothetical protein